MVVQVNFLSEKCFKSFYNDNRYNEHIRTCKEANPSQNEKIPNPPIKKFEDHDKTVDMPIVMYADIEAFLTPLEVDANEKTAHP